MSEQERREREAAEQAERAERERIAKEEAAALSAAAMPTDTPASASEDRYAELIALTMGGFGMGYEEAGAFIIDAGKWIESRSLSVTQIMKELK